MFRLSIDDKLRTPEDIAAAVMAEMKLLAQFGDVEVSLDKVISNRDGDVVGKWEFLPAKGE